MKPADRERLDESKGFVKVAGPAPEQKQAPLPAALAAAPAAAAAVASGLSAVVVVHGMGQQIQFETLDTVVEGLLRADAPGAGAQQRREQARPVVCYRRVGGKDLARAELDLHGKDGTTRRVHLYEAYWAPLTEGRVQLRDVIGFLGSGALNGTRNARSKGRFGRWMFGHGVKLPTGANTALHLWIAALVLGALVLINAITSAIFASAVLQQAGATWVSSELVAQGTLVVTALLASVAACVLLLFLTRLMLLFVVAMLLVAAAGVALGLVIGFHAAAHRALLPAPDWAANPWLVGLVWSALAGASWFVRGKLVQFVGDVAVYVTPQKLDRFAELRKAIKDTVCEVVTAVYKHGADGSAPAYERIAVVGHSLGSVAAYDALNSAINADQLEADGRWRVVDRTCLLLTFGSPLDKTAFIFKSQGHHTGETREALAAAVQPLIQSYDYRRFPWVNVWSKADIVSGSLDYYDDPQAEGYAEHKVDNLEDPAARTPLVAHTQYWTNSLIFEQLHARLV